MIENIAPGFLLAAAALNGLLVVYLLLRRAHRETATFWLALLLVALTVRFGKSAVQGFFDVGPVVRNIGLAGMLSIGPALAAYAINRPVPRTRREVIAAAGHALPAALMLLFAGAIPNAPANRIASLIYVVILVHLAAYIAVAWHALHQARNNRAGNRLVRAIATVVTAYWLMWCGIALGVPYLYVSLCAAHALLSAALCWLAFTRHPWLRQIWDVERYAHLAKSPDEAAMLLEKAAQVLIRDGLFTDPGLSLARLARRLVVPRNELSRAINGGTGQSFRNWLNGFRIVRACESLQEGWLAERQLIELAETCGFASLSSFNRAFRAVTGQTPSQYAKQVAHSQFRSAIP